MALILKHKEELKTKQDFYDKLEELELDVNTFSKLSNTSLEIINSWDDNTNPIEEKHFNWLYNYEYRLKLRQLQKEFIQIKQDANWKFDPHHKAMFDFVVQAKNEIEFQINDHNIIVRKNNKDFGFKHLLLRHYGNGSDGEIKALDILKIGNVIKQEITIPSRGNKKISFIQTKNGHKYTVILRKEKSGKLLFNFFSSK